MLPHHLNTTYTYVSIPLPVSQIYSTVPVNFYGGSYFVVVVVVGVVVISGGGSLSLLLSQLLVGRGWRWLKEYLA
ncbi:hypothetical protein V1477_016568 [Vespula maculifrons]|uniref:Uncharacterized protein n=1 Tax=Vespula maculifrons TaxID=7453 RepID=A0ABD2B8M4_VESMC